MNKQKKSAQKQAETIETLQAQVKDLQAQVVNERDLYQKKQEGIESFQKNAVFRDGESPSRFLPLDKDLSMDSAFGFGSGEKVPMA